MNAFRGVAARFREELRALGPPGRAVVAVSGGLDSTVLLHLARFGAHEAGREWVAAHFDHRMRASSAEDARWVAGLCRAWGVPLRIGVADAAPESEASARGARYAFLERVRQDTDAALLLTAHHADDQAETVLFRLLRGTGAGGLRGIPVRRTPSVARPLLPFWRAELEEYAHRAGLSWRDDPTNADARFARNVIRNRILPEVERHVAPGARGALVRLAGLADDEEAAWESVLPTLMRPLDVLEVEGGVSLLRAPFLELHAGVRARVVRMLAARLGVSLDHATTRRVVGFAEEGASGRAVDVVGSLAFGIELDRCVLARSASTGADRPLQIHDVEPGRGTVVLAGSSLPVSWGGAREVGGHSLTEGFRVDELRFPLVVRSRRPGDRIRLPAGTKKVKKVLLESRIPPSERHRIPLVVDAEGQVLWIPGLSRSEWSRPSHAEHALRIGIG